MAISLSFVREAHGPNACPFPLASAENHPEAHVRRPDGLFGAWSCVPPHPEPPSEPSDPIQGKVISKLLDLSESSLHGSPWLLTGVTGQVKLGLRLGRLAWEITIQIRPVNIFLPTRVSRSPSHPFLALGHLFQAKLMPPLGPLSWVVSVTAPTPPLG